MKRTKVNYRKIAEEYYGVSAKNMHVHHLDGNCHNNSPENLVICTKEEHANYHLEMGQHSIAALLLSQTSDNWFSAIGKLGAIASIGVKKQQYTMSDLAIEQRRSARSRKGDINNTDLVLKGSDRTDAQKDGRTKANLTRSHREKTKDELEQFDNFRNKGHAAAALALTGSKKLIDPITGISKFAIPGSSKWNDLISNGYVSVSTQ